MEEQQKQLASMHHHAPHYFSLAILVIVVGLAGIALLSKAVYDYFNK
jgi:hypothetical protein